MSLSEIASVAESTLLRNDMLSGQEKTFLEDYMYRCEV